MPRRLSRSSSSGRTPSQQWCTCGALDAVIDAKGNKASWTYDLEGRGTSEVRANGSSITYDYEATTSRLKRRTDAAGQETKYEYFLDDKAKQISYTNATISTPTVSMTYDANYGRLATMTDGIGTTTYSYEAAGTLGALNVASIDGPLSNDTLTYTYDALGRVATRALGGVTDSWSFDALGRLQSLVDPIGTFGFSYDGETARLAQLSYPNGQTSSYSYFGNSGDRRLQEIHHQTAGATTLSKFDYTYDVVGRITTWTQQYQSTTRAYDFGYDAADQLTSAVYRTTDATPTILTRYGYSYDAVGNRTNQQTDDAPTGWTYDAMNRLTGQSGTAQLKFEGTVNEASTVTVGGKLATVNASGAFVGNATVTNGTNTVAIAATDASGNSRTQDYSVDVTNAGGTFSYDANGNLTAHGTRTYSWDAENRLVQVADDGTPIASFTYGGFGRRASKTAGGARKNPLSRCLLYGDVLAWKLRRHNVRTHPSERAPPIRGLSDAASHRLRRRRQSHGLGQVDQPGHAVDSMLRMRSEANHRTGHSSRRHLDPLRVRSDGGQVGSDSRARIHGTHEDLTYDRVNVATSRDRFGRAGSFI